MKKLEKWGVLAVAMMISVSAIAEDNDASDTSIAVKIGTLGLGVEAVKPLSGKIKGRAGINYLNLSRSDTISEVDYDVDLDLQTISLLADWHPNGGGFYVSGGAMLNGNEAQATGSETGTFTLGNTAFNGDASYGTSVKFDDVAPYLGIGYRKTLAPQGWSLVAEAGVLFQGEPEVTLDVQAPASSGITQADVDNERQQIQEDLEDLKNWPVVSVGVIYQF